MNAAKVIIKYISWITWQIRSDWEDPRGDCDEIINATKWLQFVLGLSKFSEKSGMHAELLPSYLARIEETMKEEK